MYIYIYIYVYRNQWQLSYVDLQSKSFAASHCGVKKCVGTPVNMRKPLCNTAGVLIQPLELFVIALHSLWRFTAQFVISIVEISKNRRSNAMWEFPDNDLTEGNCLLKRTVVGAVSIFTATLGSKVRFTALVNHEFAQDVMRSDVMDERWYSPLLHVHDCHDQLHVVPLHGPDMHADVDAEGALVRGQRHGRCGDHCAQRCDAAL